jgi:site-specific recombinase XerD
MEALAVRDRGEVGQVRQADNDNQVITMWLHGRPETTQRAYAYEIKALMAVVVKPLAQITLADLQTYFDGLSELAPATRSRSINAIKSLFRFAQRIGCLRFNPCAAILSPKIKNTLAERILNESQVHTMIALEPLTRNRVLLRLLYAAGLRVSEICGLTWKDLQERDEAGQIAVYGKGGKTRIILLSPETWQEIMVLPKGLTPDSPVFTSRKGKGHLSPVQVHRIVKGASERAGIEAGVSPHWLRHAHASHSLDRGCPVHLVQSTLGHASLATTSRYTHARPDDSSARYLGV